MPAKTPKGNPYAQKGNPKKGKAMPPKMAKPVKGKNRRGK